MTYVVTEACIKCKYMDCVEVCPVDCFYEGENMLVIHPDECIDCGVCEPECPPEAIIPDSDAVADDWLELNKQYSETWPNITRKGEPPEDAEKTLLYADVVRPKFTETINEFNELLAARGHSGKIEEVIFIDSSYSKPQGRFMIGSDFDLFRIIYSGDIPEDMRTVFRNNVFQLALYVKPGRPIWVHEKDSGTMWCSCCDVTVYKNGKTVTERDIVNDFLERKATIRALFFTLMNNGTLLPEEIALSRKMYRCYFLSMYYGIDTPFILTKEEDFQYPI